MSFCHMYNSPPAILDALVLDMNKDKPFKIQASTIPYILQGKCSLLFIIYYYVWLIVVSTHVLGRNIIAQAQAGAGKTLAFTIGMLARIDSTKDKLQAICLTPTRELAVQIMSDAITPLKARITPPVKGEVILAGVNIARNSKSSAHVIVGTPGKVVECLSKKYLSLKHVNVFVLDEADFMVADTERGILSTI